MAKPMKKRFDEQEGARALLAMGEGGGQINTSPQIGTSTGASENKTPTVTVPPSANAVPTTPGSTAGAKTSIDYMTNALEMLSKQPETTYTPGTYQPKYAEQVDAIINDILSSKYQGYDPKTDPTYSQYKKTYLREADRTAEDVLGQYAAMNGGMPSTAAISAASQAGNNFKGQLADKIPELEAAAFNRYLSELSGKRQNLSDLISAEDLAYSLWQGEEAQKKAAYDQEQNAYDIALNRLLQGAEIAQGKEDSEASKAMSQLGYGVMPSEEGLKALGIDAATAKSLMSSEASAMDSETAMALLQLSLENGVAPSADVLSALGLSTQWGNAAVSNAVASANEGEMTAYGNYELAEDQMKKFTGTDDGRLMMLMAMVENGSITETEMQELYYDYADEYAADRTVKDDKDEKEITYKGVTFKEVDLKRMLIEKGYTEAQVDAYIKLIELGKV